MNTNQSTPAGLRLLGWRSLRKDYSLGEASEPFFVGNRLASTLDLVGPDGMTLRQKYLIGDPQACQAGSAVEMKRRGYVGAYSRRIEVYFRKPRPARNQIKIRHELNYGLE